MKVLLDSHMLGQKETGNERYWENLAVALKKYAKNYQIILYSNLQKSKLNKEFSNFDIFIPKSPLGLYRIFWGFNKAIKKHQPDLIHVQNFTPFIKTCPIVTTVHDLCFKVNPSWFGLKTRLAFNYFFKHSLNLSDAIICVSKTTKKMLLEHYSVNPEKVSVIYEAADPCFYFIENKKKVKKLIWQKFKIKNDYFLVVGNIEKRKSSWVIIDAFNKIVNKYPNVRLIFAGPNKLGIKSSKNIVILDYVSDEELNILYNGATSLVFFSICEGFGLPLVEAMITKTPIICSNIPVFKEICKKSAVFVKDSEELSQAMEKFLYDKNLQQKYSQLAYQRSKFFSWKKTATETLKIYQRVLKTKNFPITK